MDLVSHEYHVALGSRYTNFLLSQNKRKTLINLQNLLLNSSGRQESRIISVQALGAVWI